MWNKIIIFFFLISISSFGQKEGWIADFPEAFEQSVNTGKPIWQTLLVVIGVVGA